MEILRLENLSKYYTTQNAVVMGLTGISLSFGVGEFVAVTGESGSGKSTLAHVLSGIIPYESGELYVNGKPTSHYDSSDWERYRRDMIGFISQSYGILAGNTVLDNVVSTLRLYGIEPDAARERALDILREVELSEFAERKAGKLSSGQKQRLSIARALAKPSKILIADEPTGNLDRENSEKVVELLKRASRDRLVIIITHEFSEVENLATRRIILADGNLISDADLREKEEPAKTSAKSVKSDRKRPLAPYVSALTLKSHPVLSVIVCILLAAVTFIAFVLLGNFTIALDDTPSRIYSSDAFFNGDERRIVLTRTDGKPLTKEDYDKILAVKHTEGIERYGYVSDINYYYRTGTDYVINKVIVNGPNYHSFLNPDDFYLVDSPEFISSRNYLSTVPYQNSSFKYEGALPEGTYEVLSADPDLAIGDKVDIYFRNRREWAISYYTCMTFTVTGTTTEKDSGLYFSDDFAAMMTATMDYARNQEIETWWQTPMVFFPYDPEAVELTAYFDKETGIKVDLRGSEFVDLELGENEYITPRFNDSAADIIGETEFFRDINGAGYNMLCTACADMSFAGCVFVSRTVYDNYISNIPSDQISLYISDYAYTDRVLSELSELGYFAISPFRIGATTVDETLESRRTTTLAICAGAFVLIFVLQLILMRAIFSSLYDYFKLMSNIGLTAKTAHRSLVITLLGYMIVGQIVGGCLIALLNALGVRRISDIFKYLEMHVILVLLIINTVCIAASVISVIRGTKKAVFTHASRKYDIDYTDNEEEQV